MIRRHPPCLTSTTSSDARNRSSTPSAGPSRTSCPPTTTPTPPPRSPTPSGSPHDYPELLIVGLDPAIAQELLNDLAGRVYDRAERFTHGQRVGDLIDGYDAIIVNGARTEQLSPGAAIMRYGQERVRLQQIVWPDPQGRFPWNDGYAYPSQVQPVIGRP